MGGRVVPEIGLGRRRTRGPLAEASLPERRWTHCLAALLALLAGCADPPATLPNVVLIDVESLRADHIAHLGYERPTSIGLDRFRADAALFSRARAPSSASATSSASLLTGLSAGRHGVAGNGPRLANDYETLAELLRAQGFATAALSHYFELSEAAGFAQGFDRFETSAGPVEAHPNAAVMVDWLREWLASEPARPFFLYLHPVNTHAPYRVPPTRSAELLGRPATRTFEYEGEIPRAVMSGRPQARKLVGPNMQRSLVDQYDSAVRYTLDRVGEMIDLLRSSNAYDDSLIIVVGNHGEELFEHGGFGHGYTLYEEVLRVPLYVKQPGSRRAQTIETPVSSLDVVPTVLDLLGLAARPVDGQSLVPLLVDPTGYPGERVFTSRLAEPQNRARQRALLRGRYKLIDSEQRYDLPRRTQEVYDLLLDPGEQDDLAARSATIAAELSRELDRIEAADPAPSGG